MIDNGIRKVERNANNSDPWKEIDKSAVQQIDELPAFKIELEKWRTVIDTNTNTNTFISSNYTKVKNKT